MTQTALKTEPFTRTEFERYYAERLRVAFNPANNETWEDYVTRCYEEYINNS